MPQVVSTKSVHNMEAKADTQRSNKETSPMRKSSNMRMSPRSQGTFVKEVTHTSTWTKTKGKVALKRCKRDTISKRISTKREGQKPSTFVEVILGKIENTAEWFDQIKKKLKTMKPEHVEKVEVRRGSMIIMFAVEETHKIREKWIQSLLDIVFEDVLGAYIDKGETTEVTIVWQEVWPITVTETAKSKVPKKKGFREEVKPMEDKPANPTKEKEKENKKKLELFYG